MEWRNWYVSPSSTGQRREGLNPAQLTWDPLPGLYDRLTEFTRHIPWKRRLILHLCFRGTRIKIDLGDVKAAGLVAVIGLSFGLGSLLLYRLYYRYVHSKEDEKSKKEDQQKDDECHIFLESTDESSDKKTMGNNQSSSQMVASVHYSPSYGVAIGPNYNNNTGRPPCVRQRKLGSPESEMKRSHGKSRSRVRGLPKVEEADNEMGLPFVGTEKWCHDARTAKSRSALSPSLIVNCSPQSVQEKRFLYSQSDSKKSSDDGMLNIRHLQDSSVLLTPPDEDYLPYSIPQSDQNSVSEHSPLLDASREQSPYSVGDNSYSAESLSQAESLRSARLSEFDESEGEFGTTSPLPRLSNLDLSFKRNLLQRLSEWTSLSQDIGTKYGSGSGSGSGSLSPDIRSTPERRMKRSVTMGSASSTSGIESPVTSMIQGNDIGLRTSKNLEDIEDEIHQIFSEFDYLNSKLDDLKSRNNGSGKLEPMVPDDPEIMAEAKPDEMIQVEIKEAYEHWCRQANQRESRTNSVPPGDSTVRVSSRGTSFLERDLSWDGTDIGGGDQSVFGKNTPVSIPSVWSAKDGDSVDVVNTLSTMGEELDDRVWKQIEESTTSDPDLRRRRSSSGIGSPDDSSMTYDADISNGVCSNDTSLDVSSDSACTVVPIPSIGDKTDIMVYAAREWKGQTEKSQTIKQGYEEVVQRTGCAFMRQIRGDNYCALRAAFFQILRQGITLNLCREDSLQKLKDMVEKNTAGILDWTFANRMKVDKNCLFEKMTCCINHFFNKVEEARLLKSEEQRESWVVGVFNSGGDGDLLLMEAIKLLMFMQAVDLYRDNVEGNAVPSFVWLMFARDTSETPRLFLKNHLNTVGDLGGLEQIEMCLLSHTFGVSIQVYRLVDYGKSDFEAVYSGVEDNIANLPSVTLLAEDDRHYNALVS